MDGLRKPVGDQPAGVYWVRRVMVLVIVAVIIIAAWFIVTTLIGSGDEAEAPFNETSTSPTATAEAAPDPSRACVADDATLSLAATPNPVAEGTTPAFEVVVELTGDSPCTLSTTAEGTELAIRSGDQQYYSSTWCDDDPGFGDATWILQPGDRKTVQLMWSGERYDEGCEVIAPWDDGTYWAAASIGGIPATETQFQLTA
ncbi:hypothetical protein [Demequina sp. NBRC 110051]|uniref:hypothetical protein n=1 Tax=Demequina sp. NBRC 110051 TaxID=1570340 RepID=UPI0009FC38D4|nr:hypothetical protein [Demequina sp. NBRC 110051]